MESSRSSKVEGVRELLAARGLDFVSRIEHSNSPPPDLVLFVPGSRVSAEAGKGKTSRRQLAALARSIQESFGLTVEWLLFQSPEDETLEQDLSALLEHRFPATVGHLSVSGAGLPQPTVWVERVPGRKPTIEPEQIRKVVAEFFELYRLGSPGVVFNDEAPEPTGPLILRVIKQHSPTDPELLEECLRARGFWVPKPGALAAKLDLLRKKGLVSRLEDGSYVLTEEALQIVPHGRYRSSSDIERALALAKRKW